MKKVIILSIQPQWLEKILNGEKTIEIRKSIPKCDYPIDVYLYCTKPNKFPHTSNGNKVQILTFDKSTNKYRLWKSSYEKVLNGKIVAKFTLNKVERFDVPYPAYFYEVKDKLQHIVDGSCLNLMSLHHYLRIKAGYAWHIDNLEIFEKPMELKEFKYECLKGEKNRCDGCDFYYFNQNESVGTEEECLCDCMPRLTRPPQSWGYAYKEEKLCFIY